MTDLYRSPGYALADVAASYIAVRADGLRLFEVNATGYTIRETRADCIDFPAEKVKEAWRLRGKFFNQVKL